MGRPARLVGAPLDPADNSRDGPIKTFIVEAAPPPRPFRRKLSSRASWGPLGAAGPLGGLNPTISRLGRLVSQREGC
jgi:hypothetical protein